MSRQERQPESLEPAENLDPRHFYAAYVFDRANERETDIEAIIEEASKLDYPLRYWWLSDAMELQGFPDRLIVCVHHPSTHEDAGMDLYDSLKEKRVTWDDLEAAAVDEYRYLGNPAFELGDLRSPYGNLLFPEAVSEERRSPEFEDVLLVITPENIRAELHGRLGREVSDEELSAVLVYFKTALDLLGWTFYLDKALNMSVEARQERWDAGSAPNASTDIPPAGS
jgi:hypothetical protein